MNIPDLLPYIALYPAIKEIYRDFQRISQKTTQGQRYILWQQNKKGIFINLIRIIISTFVLVILLPADIASINTQDIVYITLFLIINIMCLYVLVVSLASLIIKFIITLCTTQ